FRTRRGRRGGRSSGHWSSGWRSIRKRYAWSTRCPRTLLLMAPKGAVCKIVWGIIALAYNLANFLRQLALPKPIQGRTLTSLREKLVKVGAKVVSHAKYVVFQQAEVAVPRRLFAAIRERVGRLRLACASG